MMKGSRIWERLTLGIGVLAVAALAVGLGYKAGDYALSYLRETRAAKADVVPKPPMMVKEDTQGTAVMGASRSPLLKVMVPTDDKAEATEVLAKLADTGYETYVLPDYSSVQVGAFRDQAKAKAVLKTLSGLGIKAGIE